MRKIRHSIVISDLHLGRASSYLFSQNPAYAENRKAVQELLEHLGPQDELILNGDIMEMSLSGWDQIVRETSLFFDLLSDVGPFERIVYIPGNHDHHFWRLLVEKIFLLENLEHGDPVPDLDEFPFCAVDQKFSSYGHDVILNHLWPAGKSVPEIVVKYPHHLVRVEGTDEGIRPYLVTHGHFLEDLFRPMNILIEPARLDELEAFNNIWLEAFHYHLGQAGRLSQRVRKVLDSYEKGGKKGQQMIKNILEEIYRRLDRKYHIVWPVNWVIRHSIKKIVRKISLSRHSELFGVAINTDLKKNIHAYIDKYLISRYQKLMKKDYHFPGETDIPLPFTFVFGHTHRPILEADLPSAYLHIRGETYPLVNSGGWLRSDVIDKVHGENAGVVHIDRRGWRWHSLAGRLR